MFKDCDGDSLLFDQIQNSKVVPRIPGPYSQPFIISSPWRRGGTVNRMNFISVIIVSYGKRDFADVI